MGSNLFKLLYFQLMGFFNMYNIQTGPIGFSTLSKKAGCLIHYLWITGEVYANFFCKNPDRSREFSWLVQARDILLSTLNPADLLQNLLVHHDIMTLILTWLLQNLGWIHLGVLAYFFQIHLDCETYLWLALIDEHSCKDKQQANISIYIFWYNLRMVNVVPWQILLLGCEMLSLHLF